MASNQTPKQDRTKRLLSPGTPSPGNKNPEKKPKCPPDNSMASIIEADTDITTETHADNSMAPIIESETDIPAVTHAETPTDQADHISLPTSQVNMAEIVQCVMAAVKNDLKDFINQTVTKMAQSCADVISTTKY